MLDLIHVSKTFHAGTVNEKCALRDVQFHLDDGDFVTVIGGNGAGKSTTLNAIAGSFSIDSGEIRIDGTDISRLPAHRRAQYIGRVFQDPRMGTAADMEIVENLALAARRGKRPTLRWGISAADRTQYRERLAAFDLGLEDRLHTKVDLLSGGQRQALTLLMATLSRPRLLLLDEHTAALDPKTATKVLTMTERIVREEHLTAMMVTHNMRDAIAYGNRLIMMHDGRVIFEAIGEEKQCLTVEELVRKFSENSGETFANDRALLS